MSVPRSINVIDMYHGNNVPDGAFATLRINGVYGIIHKASQGLHYIDPLYSKRRKLAAAAGLLWGAYHFLDSTDPEKQATAFLDAAGISDPNSDPILVACDYENSANQPSLQQCMTFMATIDRATPDGVHCVLYSGNLIRETLKPHVGGHQDSAMQGVEYFFQQHRLWLAEYGPREITPWPWDQAIVKSSNESEGMPAPGVWLWQFTEKGRAALPGMTDGNFFDGTFEELQKRWLA
jgi:lysozyme